MSESCNLPSHSVLVKFLETESRLAVFSLDLDGNILGSKGGMERLFGIPVTGAGERTLFDFLIPENRDRAREILKALSGGRQNPKGSLFRKETLNFSVGSSAVQTMACFFSRCDKDIVFIAEPRRMSDSEIIVRMTELNNELANLWRELSRKNAELEKANETIGRLLNTDALTGIPNRRALERFIVERFLLEKEQPFSLIMADIDHFKKVNDTHGHHAGDVVLASFGKILSGQTRGSDMAGRYGGEEFLVVMPRTGLEEAEKIAERIRAEVERAIMLDPGIRVTASFGVAERKSCKHWESLVKRADEALYLAKDTGRNKVVVSKK